MKLSQLTLQDLISKKFTRLWRDKNSMAESLIWTFDTLPQAMGNSNLMKCFHLK